MYSYIHSPSYVSYIYNLYSFILNVGKCIHQENVVVLIGSLYPTGETRLGDLLYIMFDCQCTIMGGLHYTLLGDSLYTTG